MIGRCFHGYGWLFLILGWVARSGHLLGYFDIGVCDWSSLVLLGLSLSGLSLPPISSSGCNMFPSPYCAWFRGDFVGSELDRNQSIRIAFDIGHTLNIERINAHFSYGNCPTSHTIEKRLLRISPCVD